MNDRQIQNLETKLAFLEHSLEEMNQVVFEQGIKIAKLEAKNQSIVTQLNEALDRGANTAETQEPPPPHY